MAYQDGNFTNAIQDGPARVVYPFINAPTKDTTTKGTVRNYVVVPSSYTPAAALSTDPADNTQYLIEETELTVEGGLGRYARTYCKVPGQQIEPGTIVLSKPTIPGNDAFPRNFGSYLVVQPDTTLEQYDAYKRATVTSDTGVPAFYPSGGTYTLSFDGQTTGSISHSANANNVQASLNSLSLVQDRGNVTVSGNHNSATGFTVTFANIAAATMNTAAITTQGDATLTSSITPSQNGYSQSFLITATQQNIAAFSVNVANINYNSNATIAGTITASNQGLIQNLSLTATQLVIPSGVLDVSNLSGTNINSSISWLYSALSPYGLTQYFDIYDSVPGGGNGISGTFTINYYNQTSTAITYSGNTSTFVSNLQNGLSSLSTLQNRGGATIGTTLISNTRAVFDLTFPPARLTGGTFDITAFGSTGSNIAFNTNATILASNISNVLNNVAAVSTRGGLQVTPGTVSNTSATATILPTAAALNGGTFNVTLFGQTTSNIAHNAAVSTVQAAFNDLSNVQSRGNVIVTSSSGSTSILNNTNTVSGFSIGFSNNIFAGNAASLTPSGSTITIAKTDGTIGRTQQITFASSSATRTLYAVGHEIDAGETIFIRNSGSVFANIAPSKVTVIDANTIQLTVVGSDTWASVASITEMGPRTKVNYEPGSVVIRSKTTTDFYLPGVTAGITTADDIPIPVDESGTAAFLQGVFSGQDNINVRVGELRPWRGPILLVDRTSVASADV